MTFEEKLRDLACVHRVAPGMVSFNDKFVASIKALHEEEMKRGVDTAVGYCEHEHKQEIANLKNENGEARTMKIVRGKPGVGEKVVVVSEKWLNEIERELAAKRPKLCHYCKYPNSPQIYCSCNSKPSDDVKEHEATAKRILANHRHNSPTCTLVFTEKAIVQALSDLSRKYEGEIARLTADAHVANTYLMEANAENEKLKFELSVLVPPYRTPEKDVLKLQVELDTAKKEIEQTSRLRQRLIIVEAELERVKSK